MDSGRARIILHALVTPGDVMENTPLQDLVWRVCFHWKLRPKRAVGGTTYGTGENIWALEEASLRAFRPLTEFERTSLSFDRQSPEQASHLFGQKDFTDDPERDQYTCPQGAVLCLRGNSYTTRVNLYQAPTETCPECPVRSRCTDSAEGHKLTRHFDEACRRNVWV